MKLIGTMLCLCLAVHALSAQDRYSHFTETIQGLYRLSSEEEIDEHWNDLVRKKGIPLVQEDSVAFLFRGEARKVVWMGDFNGWGYSRKFDNEGRRIPRTDIWILKASLPKNARVDYKILVDDNQWMVDPLNPGSQWSGVGGGSLNSELRMPDWQEDSLTSHRLSGAMRGALQEDILFTSAELGYQVTWSIYTPHQYDPEKTYPVVYITDGYEYLHHRMGNISAVLDNLIHLGKMQPVVAVFIDHRDPVNRSANRRMQELAMNEKFIRFVTLELMPFVEARYAVSRDRSHRAVIGTSMGGLAAAWFLFSRPDLFGKAGMQSPAFWFKPEIYSLCERSEAKPLKIFMTTGLIHDAEESVLKMQEILDKKSLPNEFRAVNQGHSWGNWRDLIDDMLIYLFPS